MVRIRIHISELRIRIQEANKLQIHRVRIYKTGLDIFYLLNCELEAEMSCS
jgi:hypothetical protein